MKAEKIAPIVFPSSRQRMFRYTLAALNTVALLGTIVFVTWILGKIISALHALVFSMAFADPLELPKNHFPMMGEVNAITEVGPTLQEPDQPFDSENLYTVDHNDWSQ